MPDLLIRDLSEAEIQRLDQRARALGLSRSEYIRRRLRHDASRSLSREDLERSVAAHADLADSGVMAAAWR